MPGSSDYAGAPGDGSNRAEPGSWRVSRLGIEPRTLGLKGRMRLSHGVARIRNLSPALDKLPARFPRVIKIWHRLRSRLLTGC